jgi:hypothetical protein
MHTTSFFTINMVNKSHFMEKPSVYNIEYRAPSLVEDIKLNGRQADALSAPFPPPVCSCNVGVTSSFFSLQFLPDCRLARHQI